ncbi:hypothetical protein EYF80_011819 [Liparis tanakae]|uniref:Uncharacterized protein n=1 Tax=Liparis tanakae TaxID=230148 RepID=A0A4Z2IJT6_9TELE|nr:hypothetical protein EYF80_011819 [Liparis tanakae]
MMKCVVLTGQQADDQVQDEQQQVGYSTRGWDINEHMETATVFVFGQAQQLFDHVVSHLLHELQGLHVVAPRGEDLVQPGEVLVQAALHAAHGSGHLQGGRGSREMNVRRMFNNIFVVLKRNIMRIHCGDHECVR